jgi:hypothetical protein
MSRILAPASKLSRAISSAPTSHSPSAIRDSPARVAGSVLSPKYADLLRNRSSRATEHTDSRGLATTHRPTPQPSIADRPKPLMQTFHSAATTSFSTASHIDAAVLPSASDLVATAPVLDFRLPLLPDSALSPHAFEATATSKPASVDGVTIVAVNPGNVLPSTFIPVHNLDVELGFAHASSAIDAEGTMVKDVWKGMNADAFDGPGAKSA